MIGFEAKQTLETTDEILVEYVNHLRNTNHHLANALRNVEEQLKHEQGKVRSLMEANQSLHTSLGGMKATSIDDAFMPPKATELKQFHVKANQSLHTSLGNQKATSIEDIEHRAPPIVKGKRLDLTTKGKRAEARAVKPPKGRRPYVRRKS